MSRSEEKPRKALIGTCIFDTYGPYPGLAGRLKQLEGIIEAMLSKAAAEYPDQRLDIVSFPEDVLSDKKRETAGESALSLGSGAVDFMRDQAAGHGVYLVLPLLLREEETPGRYRNAAVLIGRQGEIVGKYYKAHPVLDQRLSSLEGGVVPGTDVPVFDCDFGRIGIQICFDVVYEDGWRRLAQQPAEIVIWPTESPQTVRPAARAWQGGYYVVSSTTRCNASVFDPLGAAFAQIREPASVLVQQIDLSYALLNWSARLAGGEALKEAYGCRIGYRYYEAEDCGIFWSEDPSTSVGSMIRDMGFVEMHEFIEKNRKEQDRHRAT